MKLIQINKEHYIVVDDSEIKEGEFVYDLARCVIGKHSIDDYLSDYCKKITHSTQPLETYFYEKGGGTKVFGKIKSLSLQEVKGLIGEVDVDKRIYDTDFRGDVNSYKQGYNQSLEDNKEKKYTEGDMFRMLCLGNKLEKTNFDDENFSVFFNMFKKHIQSLQPKTEWEVEIVDGKFKLK